MASEMTSLTSRFLIRRIGSVMGKKDINSVTIALIKKSTEGSLSPPYIELTVLRKIKFGSVKAKTVIKSKKKVMVHMPCELLHSSTMYSFPVYVTICNYTHCFVCYAFY